ncbi:MAG: LruC domain-containing protein [Leptospira sp.]|nr:LruC domain-containing protein [Leptospira sp.]
MLKRLLSIIILLALVSACSSKKKGLPLFLLMLGGGSTGNTSSVAASPTTIENAASGDTFTVVPLDNGSSTGSGSTGGATGDDVFVTPGGETQITSNISFQVLNDTFLWDNSISTFITIRVSNEDGTLSGITVKVSEDQSTIGVPQFLSQGQTGSDGIVTIRFSVRPNVSEVIITVLGRNPKNGQLQEITGRLPIQVPAGSVPGGGNGNGGTNPPGGGGTVVVAPEIDLSTVDFGGVAGCLTAIDADCDGVLDENDGFPDDATLGWTVNSGKFTLAWEDYYQSAFITNGTVNPRNDMDLNDHVSIFRTEIDHTPTGKVKAIRGVFTHVGKGAGFNHDLRLSLDVPTSAQFEINYIGKDGNPISPSQMNCSLALSSASNVGDCVGGTLTSAELKKGLLIFPNSKNTLYNVKNAPNVGGTLNFVLGMTAEFTITFAEPVDLYTGNNVSGGHLNYFLAVSGTGERIYRPGFFKSAGSNSYDLYIDRITGFPFGVIVPGVFNYPREVVNILDPTNAGKTGYPAFKEWASSKGTLSRNWFEQEMTTSQKSYVVDIKSNYVPGHFAAILIDSVHTYAWELALGLVAIGLSLGYYFRKRLFQSLAITI